MKKRIVFLMCLWAAVTSAMAVEPTCNGGSIITAKDGTEFCKSDKTMNWWTAFAWCESQNRKLADFIKMCGNVSQGPSDTEGDCPNLQGVGEGRVWSSVAYGPASALNVSLSSGAIGGEVSRKYGNGIFALCE